jgi:integrase
MKTTPTRKKKKARKAYHIATVGRVKVSVYRRKAPNGSRCFMVSSYASGKRKFISYASEAEAIEAATTLARRLSETDTKAAQMTEEQAVEYVNAARELQPLGISLTRAVAAIVEAVKVAGDLSGVAAAVKIYKAKHKTVTPKRVADVIAELVAHRKARGKSERYLRDLHSRLNRFAETFQKNIGDVLTPELQEWLDGMKLAPRSVKNYRAALETLFSFAESRGNLAKGCNPVDDTEKVSGIDDGAIEIFTPKEITTLLTHAPEDYLPLLALGAFAGLRTAEAERLEWRDIDLASGFITIAKAKAKTRASRLVPILPNLSAWLKPYAERTGMVWPHSERERKRARREMLRASGVKWKDNALRHSFCSYRLAVTHDAAKTSLEAGNSPQMIFRHYNKPVKPADGLAWFAVLPQGEAAPVTIKPVPVVTRRQSSPNVGRLPQVGTTAAN